ncbi:probable tyrosine-protein phosphatase F54C8.4 isoform X2 [Zerene cesonia]|nr:probable tyrosine-protein phosphatase F54C8.4 isoform X2 [Zerene cesonia]XP_038213931.1 probable tyrosine-protein phosphatase F54C8.4 isoform X2 [Zerene cesonia]
MLLKRIPKLGAVIDLTNTTRYYDPQELKSAGVLHKKILMPGRIIPPEDKVTEFMDTVEEFLEKDDESLVGVHCTHGLNRTGYMVCRYLRDRLRWPAASAIDKFETARGYKIERDNYIADLLGKTPPKPDINKPTTIKPIDESFTDTVLTKDSNTYNNKRKRNQRDCNRGGSCEEDFNGRTMKYGDRRHGGGKRYKDDKDKYYRNRKESASSTDSYDFKYDY